MTVFLLDLYRMKYPLLTLASVVALLGAGCTTPSSATTTEIIPVTTAGPQAFDGELDCLVDATWSEQGQMAEDAVGNPSPKAELETGLSQWASSPQVEIVHVKEGVASIVSDGREVVVGLASAAPRGGWIITTTRGCEPFRR